MAKFQKVKKLLEQVADIYLFVLRVFKSMFTPPFEWVEIRRQAYLLGVKTVFLVGFTSFLAGIVFTRQSRPSLIEFGAESWLPSLVSIAIVRSLGPLITALISAGKMGSNIGAELGSMNVTEQIDAMDVSGTDPFRYLVVSRVVATAIILPILVIYADTIALVGAYFAVNYYSQTSADLFFFQIFDALSYADIFTSVIKPIFFGLAIGLTSTYFGYNSQRATTGVGKAANKSVVVSMLLVFIIDLLVLQVVSIFS